MNIYQVNKKAKDKQRKKDTPKELKDYKKLNKDANKTHSLRRFE